MNYKEIKIEILTITNELNSVVSTGNYDYTHQPSIEEIERSIEYCIEQLKVLKNNL